MTDERNMDDEDDTPLAAEYVLGLLSAQGSRDLQLRLKREPALAAEVEFWEQRLGVLALEVKSLAPPAQVWARIAAAVGENDRTSHSGIWIPPQ